MSDTPPSSASGRWPISVCRYGNAIILIGLAIYFFVTPAAIISYDVTDPHLRQPGIPRCAARWHRSLTPRYERWARERVANGAAQQVDANDVSGTEWPVFGSVFYLWATESLQEAWDRDHALCPVAPREYARGAIEAAVSLIADPFHAAWVKQKWGSGYLHRENLFYRSLLIAGLTSHQLLLGGNQYLSLLRDQVETLSGELDASPHGLLNDYPGECYPTDVLAAVAIIRRADRVLNTDHSAFVRRAIRAFRGDLLDPVGLPPYAADTQSGIISGRSRGCGDSFLMVWTPALWPQIAPDWYARYELHFWQHRWTASGFREFPKDEPNRDWYMDVDSGPVIAGHGIAACAFGIGAARANGRFDHAYPLSAEMLIASWPLIDGTLGLPRMLSNGTDAPYLGEAGVLFCLTRQPEPGASITTSSSLPAFFYLGLAGYWLIGIGAIVLTIRSIRRWRVRTSVQTLPLARIQASLWLISVLIGCLIVLAGQATLGLVALLSAQLLPLGEKLRTSRATKAIAREETT